MPTSPACARSFALSFHGPREVHLPPPAAADDRPLVRCRPEPAASERARATERLGRDGRGPRAISRRLRLAHSGADAGRAVQGRSCSGPFQPLDSPDALRPRALVAARRALGSGALLGRTLRRRGPSDRPAGRSGSPSRVRDISEHREALSAAVQLDRALFDESRRRGHRLRPDHRRRAREQRTGTSLRTAGGDPSSSDCGHSAGRGPGRVQARRGPAGRDAGHASDGRTGLRSSAFSAASFRKRASSC